jgi:hypothetical protein
MRELPELPHRVERFAQTGVVLRPALVEVGGQVFVGVASLVRPGHPTVSWSGLTAVRCARDKPETLISQADTPVPEPRRPADHEARHDPVPTPAPLAQQKPSGETLDE